MNSNPFFPRSCYQLVSQNDQFVFSTDFPSYEKINQPSWLFMTANNEIQISLLHMNCLDIEYYTGTRLMANFLFLDVVVN